MQPPRKPKPRPRPLKPRQPSCSARPDRKSTRLNSSHLVISYAVFCLKKNNEELETSKEELQSVNEELQTVNSELTNKVEELDRANSDLNNLFQSTQIATIFLDRNLVI